MKRNFMIIILFIATLYLYGANKEINKTLPYSDEKSISIKIFSGSAIVKGWEKSEVNIKGWIEKNVDNLITENQKDKIIIKSEISSNNLKSKKDIGCFLTISVPVKCFLKVETTSGAIDVSQIENDIKINTVNGEIIINTKAENIDVQTISGNIAVEGSSNLFLGMSISGSITIKGDHPCVKINTSSGKIYYESLILRNMNIYSTSGDVTVKSTKITDAHIEVDSLSGTIHFNFPNNAALKYFITSISGGIQYNKNSFDDIQKEDRKLILIKGNGNAMVFVESMSGNISIDE